MKTLSRKQRELQQREELFLNTAERMLLERGYLGTNMDRVAEATEYSKGTLYQHFTCKEDLIAAIMVRSMTTREDLFGRAAKFRGRPRERMTAVGVADRLYVQLFPDHERIERITKVESIWDKASEQRRSQFMRRDNNCIGVMRGIIRDAVAQGDLELPQDLPESGLAFGLWSMAMGGRIIIHHGLAYDLLDNQDPERALDYNYQMLLDGYGWRPLSREWDYAAMANRAREEIFAEDLRRIGTQ
jgi:AcrR family transcriptional regulator